MAKSDDANILEAGGSEIPARASRLGPGLTSKAEITGHDDLVIQGPFKGLIALSGGSLTIDRNAVVEAEVEASDVIIHGALTGDIRASGRAFLAASSRVKGNISAVQITIQDGAMFRGAISMKSKGD
jgi:cytoskeletal protein CcmA (bactofilin family)